MVRLTGCLVFAVGAIGGCGQQPQKAVAAKTAACAGAKDSRCVVYGSGEIDTAGGERLLHQLQGTSPPSGSPDRADCRGGYCAVAVMQMSDDGSPRLLAHVESSDVGSYEPPTTERGLIVFRSNLLGTGLFNDDIVLERDANMRRIDVQSWKEDAGRMTPNANSYFDWSTDYGAMVGEISLLTGEKDEWHRDPKGGCARVFLKLEGAALKVAAPPTRLPDFRC